ncbi:hypothetical protein DFS34DRAFT_101316 [Phlyctochytrium arcticum]|nr:hypothetical protein DFS34DRAFT_101316 [Phlyctochytrium arcticum]
MVITYRFNHGPPGLNIFTSNCKPETGMDILDDDSDSDSDSHKDEDEVAKPVEKEIEAAMTDTSVGVEDEWSVHPALAAIPVDGSSDEEEREATEEVEDTREGDVVSGDTSDPHDGDEQSKVNMDVDRHSHSLNSDTPDLEDDHDDAQPRLSASPPSPSSSPAPSDPPPFPSNPHYLSYIAPDPQGIYPLPYALILTSLSQFLGVDSQVVERCVQDTERKLRGEAGWVQAAVKSIKRE